jgi:hypothetical protein
VCSPTRAGVSPTTFKTNVFFTVSYYSASVRGAWPRSTELP